MPGEIKRTAVEISTTTEDVLTGPLGIAERDYPPEPVKSNPHKPVA